MTEIALGDDGKPRNTWKPPTREDFLVRTPEELVDFLMFFAGTYAEAVACSGPDSAFAKAREQCTRDVFAAAVRYLPERTVPNQNE